MSKKVVAGSGIKEIDGYFISLQEPEDEKKTRIEVGVIISYSIKDRTIKLHKPGLRLCWPGGDDKALLQIVNDETSFLVLTDFLAKLNHLRIKPVKRPEGQVGYEFW
jgi:hypothetical protein